MLTLEQIRRALRDRNCAAVGRATGLTGAYVRAIRSGKANNPSFRTVKKLSDYLIEAAQ
jgi:transcriptional regulator with XRE-family HTH domain